MVLLPPEHAGLLGVPAVRIFRRPGVFDRPLDHRPIAAQPCIVARIAPFAIGFDRGAEMSVGARTDDVEAGAERQALTEGETAARQQVIGELRLAQRPLQRRKKPSQRLLIVPHMRAAPFAGALADMLALPPPKLAALQADHGRAAQNAERPGYRIDDLGRIRRAEQRIPKSAGLRLEFVPTLERLGAARARIRPLRRIVVRPCRRIAGIFRIAGVEHGRTSRRRRADSSR